MESKSVTVSEKDFESSIFNTDGWRKQFEVTVWEHDYEAETYRIEYVNKKEKKP